MPVWRGCSAAGNYAADPRDQRCLALHGDDASRGSHHIDDIALPAARTDRIPVGIEGAYGK